MSPLDTDAYDVLVKKSQMKRNFGDVSYNDMNTNILIPCDLIKNFYNDSLFYMHFYNILYIELWKLDITNNNKIEVLSTIIKNLTINFSDSSQTKNVGATTYNIMGELIFVKAPNNYVYTFYLGTFQNHYNTLAAYNIYDTYIQRTSGNRIYPLTIKRKVESSDPSNILLGRNASAYITIDMSTGSIINNTVTIVDGGSQYTADNIEIDLSKLAIDFKVDDNSSTKLEFTYQIGTNGTITGITPRITAPNTSGGSERVVTTSLAFSRDIINYIKPAVCQIVKLDSLSVNPIDTSISSANGGVFSAGLNYNLGENLGTKTYNDIEVRKKRFRKVISEVLNTPVQNIFSYLFYNKIYYNVIVCNTSLQLLIRHLFWNTSESTSLANEYTSTSTSVVIIKKHIEALTNNLKFLDTSTTKVTKDFVVDKDYYAERIMLLNETKTKYNTILDGLNNVVNNYNQYLLYYQKLKTYANIIIIFLVILIVITVTITVLPMFNYNSKNTYYILVLILLIILTIIYYNTFKHVSLYENFTTPDCTSTTVNINCSTITTTKSREEIEQISPSSAQTAANNNAKNYASFFNAFTKELTDYSSTYLMLNDSLSTVIYVGNNRTFSQDANIYLYKLYVEKRKKNNINELKKNNLSNLIQAIKKQIIYLFNIILIISFITIVMLVCLIWYNLALFNINLILAFAAIAIIIIMFYFYYSIIQPTRMLANKNYWANTNPSKDTINTL